jgi:hypothetical protein
VGAFSRVNSDLHDQTHAPQVLDHAGNESRLEGGGVNRRNLKFTNLSTNYKPGLALEMNSSPREGKTNQPKNKADEHSDLFYRGSVLENLVPVEVVTKTGSLSTLSLSQTVT